MMEDDLPLNPGRIVIELGADLSDFSVEELDERIVELEGEIERLKASRDGKAKDINAAHAFFNLKS